MLDVRRHVELFDPTTFKTPITIIGVGATGSWLAMFLAKLGITDISVYDYDRVEEHNVPNQLFGIDDVGMSKVFAVQVETVMKTGTTVRMYDEKFETQRLAGIVFLMVDSMNQRKAIWERAIKMKPSVQLLIEPRMGLDLGRIYVVDPTDSHHVKMYESTYYTDEESEVSACGSSQTVITTAVAVASWCARQLINHHEVGKTDNEILIDFRYNNIVANRW